MTVNWKSEVGLNQFISLQIQMDYTRSRRVLDYSHAQSRPLCARDWPSGATYTLEKNLNL